MARIKKTYKKKVDPPLAPKKVYKGSGKSLPLRKPITVRRFSQGVRCLMEIRKAMKALDCTMPKLPFQRICREICDEWKLVYRWQRVALDCLHEAVEDFLVEFF